MKTNQITISIPDGYKAEIDGKNINIVEDKPTDTCRYRIIHDGVLSTTIYNSKDEAIDATKEGDIVTQEEVPSPSRSSASAKKGSSFHLPIKWHWLALAIGLLLIAYGLYKFILTDNETSTTFSLVKIAVITIIGALITFFSWKGGEQ